MRSKTEMSPITGAASIATDQPKERSRSIFPHFRYMALENPDGRERPEEPFDFLHTDIHKQLFPSISVTVLPSPVTQSPCGREEPGLPPPHRRWSPPFASLLPPSTKSALDLSRTAPSPRQAREHSVQGQGSRFLHQ